MDSPRIRPRRNPNPLISRHPELVGRLKLSSAGLCVVCEQPRGRCRGRSRTCGRPPCLRAWKTILDTCGKRRAREHAQRLAMMDGLEHGLRRLSEVRLPAELGRAAELWNEIALKAAGNGS